VSELKSTHDPEQEFGVGEAHTVETISDFITEEEIVKTHDMW